MTKSNQPRLPTHEERQQLIAWNLSLGVDRESASGLVDGAFIAVFDNYMTECPGYVGKVMSVVWSGAPSIYDVFTWEDGTLRHEDCECCASEHRDHPAIVARVA
jgi:hypothetical protein